MDSIATRSESVGSRASARAPSDQYEEVRRATVRLLEPLSAEDAAIQSMPEASPTKWHLAHTTWFFETFVLSPAMDYTVFDPRYGYLFNSYYNAVGPRHCRPRRGLLSRPALSDVLRYREHVDRAMAARFASGMDEATLDVVTLGLHHEQQHQELILTDIKHVFARNPLRPVYRAPSETRGGTVPPLAWKRYPAGLTAIGFAGDGFTFDNETPRHRVFLESFEIASRAVTNGEYRAFMEDRGYARPELWLSDGWNAVTAQGWTAPSYWEERDGRWWSFTLGGMRAIDDREPVCHVSYYEADAFARWAGARLPREEEWERAAEDVTIDGTFVEDGALHPRSPAGAKGEGPHQMFGDVWEWTQSPYVPYPGYHPLAGALGEYNGKFMCNQLVLRGGSCVTPRTHIRATYRNFFVPDARWQFSGIRLARDVA